MRLAAELFGIALVLVGLALLWLPAALVTAGAVFILAAHSTPQLPVPEGFRHDAHREPAA